MDSRENKFCSYCGHEVKISWTYDYDANKETIIRECDHCKKSTEWGNKKETPM
jgi:endogenous inhibitor of DNA gyrase (YacG/DUF329 family)